MRIGKKDKSRLQKNEKKKKCEGKKRWKENRNIGEEKKNFERKGHVRNKEIKGEMSERNQNFKKVKIIKE